MLVVPPPLLLFVGNSVSVIASLFVGNSVSTCTGVGSEVGGTVCFAGSPVVGPSLFVPPPLLMIFVGNIVRAESSRIVGNSVRMTGVVGSAVGNSVIISRVVGSPVGGGDG